MTASRQSRWSDYAFAVTVSVLTLTARLHINVDFGERPLLLLFILPIIFSALRGGFGPGLVSTLIVTISAVYFLPPAYQFVIAYPFDIFQVFLLIFEGILVSLLINEMRRGKDDFDAAKWNAIDLRTELRRKEDELAEIQRIAHIGCWYWDVQTDDFQASEECCRIFGRKVLPPFTEQGGTLYPPETWKTLNAAVQEALQEGTPCDMDLPALGADGAPMWINIRGNPVRKSGGTIIGLRGMVQDITERKQAKTEREPGSDGSGQTGSTRTAAR